MCVGMAACPAVFDVAVVGGGMSGLSAAAHLARHSARQQSQQPALNWVVLEANALRFGGRMLSTAHGVDLGPAWIWPHYGQRHVAELVASTGAETFYQPDDRSAMRVVGGTAELASRLAASLPGERLKLDWPVRSLTLDDAAGVVEVRSGDEKVVHARRVIVAIPPRLAHLKVEFSPPLSPEKVKAMEASRTWMAGVTKVVLRYPSRFWPLGPASNAGLRRGPGRPAFQVYDGTGDKEAGGAALTFFCVADDDSKDDAQLGDQVAKQLGEYWSSGGLDASSVESLGRPLGVEVQRWPKEKWIADDPNPTFVHPHPEPVRELARPEWQGRLLFAGTETDQSSPGVIEGAIGAGVRAAEDALRGL